MDPKDYKDGDLPTETLATALTEVGRADDIDYVVATLAHGVEGAASELTGKLPEGEPPVTAGRVKHRYLKAMRTVQPKYPAIADKLGLIFEP